MKRAFLIALAAAGLASSGCPTTAPQAPDAGKPQLTFQSNPDSGEPGRDAGPTEDDRDAGPEPSDGGAPGQPDGGTVRDTGCADATQFIYVIAEDNSLYAFFPPTLTFNRIGVVNCPDLSGPWSMAVDREAQIWMVFGDGDIYQISATNAACSGTSFVAGQHGFSTFGMGFSTNAAMSDEETLFISADTSDLGLAVLDTTTLKVEPVGAYTGLTGNRLTGRAELTGTGAGELFGAFEGDPFVVAGINKTTAAILSEAPQNGINNPAGGSNFAFAAWGGDFYLFHGAGTSTDVFLYSTTAGTTTKVTHVSFEIVGAGVSTCAP